MSTITLKPNAGKPASKIGALRDLLFALLQEHERDGMQSRPTRGFCIYELVQRGQISKVRTGARRSDQDLHDALTDIREDGRIPWDWIIDETRSVEDYTGYQTVKQGLLAKLPYTNLDPWRGRAPLILTESRSLAGVLRPIIIEHRNRIAPTNGQCGGFLRTDVAPLLQPGDAVGYLGDLDLAGGQIEANTRRVLEQEIGGDLSLGAAGADRQSRSSDTTCRRSSSATAATRTTARTRRSRPRPSASAC